LIRRLPADLLIRRLPADLSIRRLSADILTPRDVSERIAIIII